MRGAICAMQVLLFFWLFYDAVTTGQLESVGHSLQSTPTDGRRFTALGLPWQSPIQVGPIDRGRRALTSVNDQLSYLSLVATARTSLWAGWSDVRIYILGWTVQWTVRLVEFIGLRDNHLQRLNLTPADVPADKYAN
jgi:hypothetical protein